MKLCFGEYNINLLSEKGEYSTSAKTDPKPAGQALGVIAEGEFNGLQAARRPEAETATH